MLQKSLREKKKLHLGKINTSYEQSKMDDTSDLLNLLEQKVITPLSERSRKMPTTAQKERGQTYKSSLLYILHSAERNVTGWQLRMITF